MAVDDPVRPKPYLDPQMPWWLLRLALGVGWCCLVPPSALSAPDSASVPPESSKEWTKVVAENSNRLRGAASEISDVQNSLVRVEQLESRVQRDLLSLLRTFGSNYTEAPGDKATPPAASSAKGRSGRRGAAKTDSNADLALALSEHLSTMRRDLASLVTTINATRKELSEAREAVGSTEKALEEARLAERRAKVAERLRDGKATVDYETGKVSTLLSPSERRKIGLVLGASNLSRIEAQLLEESLGLRREGSSKHSARRFDRERQRADPAMLHLDTRFLQDMVVLSLATALGGLLAAALGAPVTLGNMLGGVVVGPSCLDLVRNLEQTETLAQFGSIFLLFSHGLLYSRVYGGARSKKPTAAGSSAEEEIASEPTEVSSSDAPELDAVVEPVEQADVDVRVGGRALGSGFALVLCLGVSFACASRLVGVADGLTSAALYSAAFSLSSSNTVLSTLREARLDDSVFGRAVVELLSVQDLVLAPLFALPTAVSDFAYGSNKRGLDALDLAWLAATYTVLVVAVVVAARRVLPRALAVLGGEGTLPNDVGRVKRRTLLDAPHRSAARTASLGLCVTGYALAMALLADRLRLSHEAGALFAGLVLVGTPHVDKAKRAVEPLTALFGGMYLASLGLVASPRYLKAHALPLLATVSAVLAVKLAVVAPLVYGLGFSRLAALAAGCIFGQVSEVSLFVAARAHRLHLVQRATYLDVLSSTVVLLAIAPISGAVLRRIDRKHFCSLENRAHDARPATSLRGLPFRCLANLFFSAQRRFLKKP